MSTAASPKPDSDPMVISYVKFIQMIPLGNTEVDHWSLERAASSAHHGRVRVKPHERGLVFCFKAGSVYQEHTVYEGNLADVCRVPLSTLPVTVRETWERAEKEVRR